MMTPEKQERLDKIVSDLKRLAKELDKPNITIADCRNSSSEYAITWIRNNCGLNFNALKKVLEYLEEWEDWFDLFSV